MASGLYPHVWTLNHSCYLLSLFAISCSLPPQPSISRLGTTSIWADIGNPFPKRLQLFLKRIHWSWFRFTAWLMVKLTLFPVAADDQKSAPLLPATCTVHPTGIKQRPLLLKSLFTSSSLITPSPWNTAYTTQNLGSSRFSLNGKVTTNTGQYFQVR